MHDPYDDEDDGYDDDYYDHDYNDQYDPYKFYFKFDVSQNPTFSKWINDIVNNLINPLEDSIMDQVDKAWGVDKNVFVFPVNSWNPNTGGKNLPQYLGSNYNKEPIWKNKYFINNNINNQYKQHLQSNAAHFVKQPNYYKGLFDILN
jgi:hypothetical protein